MFLAKKLITYWLLLPPGNIILFLTLLGLYLLFKGFKKTALFSLIMATGLYLLSIKPVAVFLIKPLENVYPISVKFDRKICKAVVILGGGIKLNAPFLDLPNDLREDAFKRATAAVVLYREKKERIFIPSGYSVENKVPEAEVIKDYLTYMGVPEQLIYPESKSRDTYENAEFVYRMLRTSGIKRVCLITSAYHMPRAMLLFTKVGFKKENLIPVPVDYKQEKVNWNKWEFLPYSYWLDISAKALHEYLGLLYYKYFSN